MAQGLEGYQVLRFEFDRLILHYPPLSLSVVRSHVRNAFRSFEDWAAKNGGFKGVAARSLTGEGGIIMQRTTRNPTCWSHAPAACTPHSTTSTMLSYSAAR